MQLTNNLQNAQIQPNFNGVRKINVSGFNIKDQVPVLEKLEQYPEFKKFVDKYDVNVDIFKDSADNSSNLVVKVLGNPLEIPKNLNDKMKKITTAIQKKCGNLEISAKFPNDNNMNKLHDYLTLPDSKLVRETLVWESPCLKVDDVYEREYEHYHTLRKDIAKLETNINRAKQEVLENSPEEIAKREKQKELEMAAKKLQEQKQQQELTTQKNSLINKILNMGRKILK